MIERSASPAAVPSETGTSFYGSPAGRARAGGDWCAILELDDEAVALVLGDVAGHGRAVAGKMMDVRTAVLAEVVKKSVPSSVLAVGNEVVFGWNDGTLVTAIVAIVDRRRRTLTFANAGHPPPLLVGADEHAFLAHRPADLPLGVFARHSCADYVIALPVDALLVLYTDGITEHARDPLRGEEELVEAARHAYSRPHVDAAPAIARRVLRRSRGSDDAAAIAIRTRAAER